MLLSYIDKNKLEAGCDEAGRGCLAGPVFAAAVILPSSFYHPLLNDSKQMKVQHREELREYIEQNALAFAVAKVSAAEIDKINILQASIKAMRLALDALIVRPESILVDGNRFIPYQAIPHQTIIKGDTIYASIAAASVLAKTYRDAHMARLHSKNKPYNWLQNKGYPTATHRAAIAEFGITKHHRKTFIHVPLPSTLLF